MAEWLEDRDPVGAESQDTHIQLTLAQLICGIFAAACGVPSSSPSQSLLDLGGDSLAAAEVAAVISDATGVRLSIESVLTASGPAEVAGVVYVSAAQSGGIGGLIDNLTESTGVDLRE